MTQNALNTGEVLLKSVSTSIGTLITVTGNIPQDDTIPQNTEGDQVLTLAITPTYSTSKLEIFFSGLVTGANLKWVQVALFQDATASAINANSYNINNHSDSCQLRHIMTSGTTSSTTFKIRVGLDSGTCYINGDAAGVQTMGGVSATNLIINEYL
jgi:hypothetical protein